MSGGLNQAGWRPLAARARRLCKELVRDVATVHQSRASADSQFFVRYMAMSEQLASLLELLGIAFPAQGRPCESSTLYGLPIVEEGWVATGLVSDLVPTWLEKMRVLEEELVTHTAPAPSRPAKGGRPKASATRQLEADLQAWVKSELGRLSREGLPRQLAARHVCGRGIPNVVTAINESLGRSHPLTEATRKKIARSPVWKKLKSISAARCGSTNEPGPDPMRNCEWALEQGLRPTARG